MAQRRTLLVGGSVLAVLALGVAIAFIGPSDFFLPEQSTQVDDQTMLADGEVIKQGSFVGSAGHQVSGTVVLAEDEEGALPPLRELLADQGPGRVRLRDAGVDAGQHPGVP